MNQSTYDSILTQLTDEMEIIAFKKLWKRYNQYWGAVMYAKTPEIHIHYSDRDSELVQNL